MKVPNAAYYERIRHILKSSHLPDLIIVDPVGYKTSDEEFTRTLKNVGIISNFSQSLTFVRDGKDYIENIIYNYGLNEEITITKETKNNTTDVWEEEYTSTLDLLTFEEEDKVKVKINSGGFDKIFKSRESESVELERTEDLDSNTIDPLIKRTVDIEGRKIFLSSELKESGTSMILKPQSHKNHWHIGERPVPLEVVNKSDELVHEQVSAEWKQWHGTQTMQPGIANNIFYGVNDKEKTLNLSISYSFSVKLKSWNRVQWTRTSLQLVVYEGGTSYLYKEALTEFVDVVKIGVAKVNSSGSKTLNVNLMPGESLSLMAYHVVGGNNNDHGHSEIIFEDMEFDITIEEDSVFQKSTTQTLLLHDVGERLTNLITGEKNKFKSSVLGSKLNGYNSDGNWGYLGCYSGHWLRGFGLSEEEDNKYKKIATSFNDFKQTLKSVLGVYVGFQNFDGEDYVVAEELDYFFNSKVILKLETPLKNVKKTIAEDAVYSSVDCGYEKGVNIEEVQGLDEPNGKANWVSILTSSKNKYNFVSKYLAAVYAEEKQRRFPKETFPDEDKQFDTDIFLKDFRKLGSKLFERKWSNDFTAKPRNIYNPETVKNLRLSPANNLRRNKRLLSVGFDKYQADNLAFSSSDANSEMITTFSENENIKNSDLGKPLFKPYYIEGEHLVDSEIMKILKGYTVINGIKVPNFYCKVEFIVEDKTHYGYIMSVKPNGTGKFKFIEAN